MNSTKPEAHLQLLATLFKLFYKSRREGLMSIEMDVEHPRESEIFTAIAGFDESNVVIYDLLCDCMRLMLGGTFNITLMTRYLASARRSLDLAKNQETLFDALEASVLAMLEGCLPAIAVEFGRQCIPANKMRPSFDEFEHYLRALRQPKEVVLSSEETDAILVRFFAGCDSTKNNGKVA